MTRPKIGIRITKARSRSHEHREKRSEALRLVPNTFEEWWRFCIQSLQLPLSSKGGYWPIWWPVRYIRPCLNCTSSGVVVLLQYFMALPTADCVYSPISRFPKMCPVIDIHRLLRRRAVKDSSSDDSQRDLIWKNPYGLKRTPWLLIWLKKSRKTHEGRPSCPHVQILNIR